MKVLIIFSWDDDVSQARHERMRQDRRLKSYDFHQRFALPSPRAKPEADVLFAMISTAIDKVKPDVLLSRTCGDMPRRVATWQIIIATTCLAV